MVVRGLITLGYIKVGINLKQGYNGDLTAKQTGSIGGQMVNNICPVRHMNFTRKNRTVKGYERQITYGFRVVVQILLKARTVEGSCLLSTKQID